MSPVHPTKEYLTASGQASGSAEDVIDVRLPGPIFVDTRPRTKRFSTG
jgi:hypothetical protein